MNPFFFFGAKMSSGGGGGSAGEGSSFKERGPPVQGILLQNVIKINHILLIRAVKSSLK